jgi:hypothetical protein
VKFSALQCRAVQWSAEDKNLRRYGSPLTLTKQTQKVKSVLQETIIAPPDRTLILVGAKKLFNILAGYNRKSSVGRCTRQTCMQ